MGLLNLPKCSFYRREDKTSEHGKMGRHYSMFTVKETGSDAVVRDNGHVVNVIEKLLSVEFVCY